MINSLISVEGNICSAFNSINLIKCLGDYDYEIYEVDNINYARELQNFKMLKLKGLYQEMKLRIFSKKIKSIFLCL